MQLHEVQRPPVRPEVYVAPTSLDDALEILHRDRGRAKVIAGGTDLLVELDRGGHDGVDSLVALDHIPELGRIDVADGVVRLGGFVTHNQVIADQRCVEAVLPLAQACLEVGSPQLRNRATVAGNVVTASPANDTISALLALGASVELSSVDGVRTVPVAEFITGFRQTVLGDDELVTATLVPALGPHRRGIFVKLGLRRAQAISVVHLAIVVTFDPDRGSGDTIADLTVAIGSVAETVLLVPDLREQAVGRRLDPEVVEEIADALVMAARPIDDIRATADYRLATVRTMATRALHALAIDAQADHWPTRPPLLSPGGAARAPMPTTRATTTVAVGPGDPVTATVNGRRVTETGAAGVTLLDWLRDRAGTTGVKEGCAEGECGACTVELDGAAVMSCLVPAARADGATIVTVEGLGPAPGTSDDGTLHPIQQAFVDTDAVQCGFCTPGLLVAGAALLAEIERPDRAQIRQGLAGNLCRCTGYVSIERAVGVAAAEPPTPSASASAAGGVER